MIGSKPLAPNSAFAIPKAQKIPIIHPSNSLQIPGQT